VERRYEEELDDKKIFDERYDTIQIFQLPLAIIANKNRCIPDFSLKTLARVCSWKSTKGAKNDVRI
jgi:hypothetical protein